MKLLCRMDKVAARTALSCAVGILALLTSAEKATAVPANEQASTEPIKIGFITSLSGVAAPGGQQMVKGIKLYLEQINNQIAGRPVELLIENDESNPTVAIAKVNKLVNQDKVHILDGIILSNIAYAVAPSVERNHIPMLLPVTAADDLTKRKRNKWLIRTGWSASQVTQPFGEWVYKKLGYRNVITFGFDFALGWETVAGFQKTFEDAGGHVIQKIWAPPGFADFSPYLKNLEQKPDAIFVATANAGADYVPKQIRQVAPHLPIIALGTSFDETNLIKQGDDALGVLSVLFYSSALDNPANKRFVSEYREKYKEETSLFSEGTYTSGMFMEQAITAIKGHVEDHEALLAALKNVQLKNAPRGPLKLDQYNNPIENVYVRKVERIGKKGGKLQNKVINTFPNVSQFWHWQPKEYMDMPQYGRDYPPCKYCR